MSAPETSVIKLVFSQLARETAELAVSIQGLGGMLAGGDAPADGYWQRQFLSARRCASPRAATRSSATSSASGCSAFPATPGSTRTSRSETPSADRVAIREHAGRRPMEFNLADLFECVAARVPEREAVVWGDSRLTYRQLDERANRLAHGLQAMGHRRRATTSGSTRTAGPSTSRRWWPPTRSAPSPST